jgi:hypothetical protein
MWTLFSGSFIGFGFGFFLLAWVVWKIRHALDKQYGIPSSLVGGLLERIMMSVFMHILLGTIFLAIGICIGAYQIAKINRQKANKLS